MIIRYKYEELMAAAKPTLIFAASMQRSASTWLFNVARVLLSSQEALAEKFSSGWIGDLDKMPMKPVMLVKVHDFHPKIIDQASFIFYSFRDVRDVLASMYRQFGQEPTLDAASSAIENHECWLRYAGFVMKYEDMAANKLVIVQSLAEKLGIKEYEATKVVEEVDGLKKTNSDSAKYDTTNLYHKGHITDGRHGSWEGILNKDLEKKIVDKHYDWFKRYGYVD
mgnify:CR=1 FL=1